MSFAFPADTVAFLADLRANNDKAWFDANRDRYQAAYVEPAKAFVEAVAPGLDEIVPGIEAQPKVLGSIFRINRDIRFSKDKRPYKDHLDFWFWEGERKAAVSGLFMRVSPDGLFVGAGAHHFSREHQPRFRAASGDPALAAIVERLGPVDPRGGLNVVRDFPASAAAKRTLVPTVLAAWRDMAPLHSWIVANVQGDRP